MVITAKLTNTSGKFAQRRRDRRPIPHPEIAGAMLLPLTRGSCAVIDECDAEAAGEMLWYWSGGSGIEYAATTRGGSSLSLHRFIWERMGGTETPHVDHRDRNGPAGRRGGAHRMRGDWAVSASANWEALRVNVIGSGPGGCWSCGDDRSPIHVHHRYYESGKQAWEYPVASFEALCPRCHGHADELRRKMVRATGMIGESLAMRALGYMHALAADDENHESGSIQILSYEHAYGVGDAYVLSAEVVLSLERNGAVDVADLIRAGGHAWRHK